MNIQQLFGDPDIGEEIGGGLGSALSFLAEAKIKQKVAKAKDEAREEERRRLLPGLQSLMPNQNQDYINDLSMLSPGLQLEAYRNYKAQQPQALVQDMGRPQMVPPQFQEPMEMPEQSAVPVGLRSKSVPMEMSPEDMEMQQAPAPSQAPELASPKIQQIDEKLANPNLTGSQRAKLETQRQNEVVRVKDKQFKAQIGAQQKEDARIEKANRPVYNRISESNKAAKENDIRLKRMRTLINKGNLPVGFLWSSFQGMAEGLKHIPAAGGVLSGVVAPVANILSGKYSTGNVGDVEEFEKLSKDFLRSAKDIFGARITNLDLNSFMQMIPTLNQTDAGKMRIINNMQGFNDGIHAREKAMNKLIDTNNGRLPDNLSKKIEEVAGPELDYIAEKMQLGYGNYDLGENKDKLPPATSAVIGATTAKNGRKYINTLTDSGPKWQLIHSKKV